MNCPFVIKVCTKCKRILVANEMNFSKKKDGKYGLRADCKDCRKKYKSELYKINKKIEKEDNLFDNIDINKIWNHCPFCIKVCSKCERILIANKDNFNKCKTGKYKLDAECKVCQQEYAKQRYKENKESISKYKKEYNKKNKIKNSERYKKWARNNPDKIFNKDNKRRLIEKNQGNGISKEQWLEMMSFFEWKCAYSGEKFSNNNKENDRSVDHIIPLTKNGENEIWNCVPMKSNLNSSKNNNSMLNWYRQQEFYSVERLQKILDWITYSIIKWKYNGVVKGE